MFSKEDQVTPPFTLNWTLSFQVLFLISIVGLLFWSSIAALFERWVRWDEDMSHGIPTLILFFVLVSQTFPKQFPRDSKLTRGLLLLILGTLSVVWFLLIKTNIVILANISIFLIIGVFIAVSFNCRSALSLIPAYSILIFTLPIFSQVNNLLIQLSAKMIGLLVPLLGITALIDGQNIYLSAGHIFIADGCSGLRYLTIALLMSYLISILNNYSLWRGILSLAIGAALGVLTNWIRILTLVVIGQKTGMKSELMHSHEMFGWLLFASIMLPAIYFAPIIHSKKKHETQHIIFKPWIPILVLSVGPILLFASGDHEKEIKLINLAMIDGYSIQTKDNNHLNLHFPDPYKASTNDPTLVNSSSISSQTFLVNEVAVRISLAKYYQENTKNKLVPYFDTLFSPEEWLVADEAKFSALNDLQMNVAILKKANEPEFHVMVYRFELGKYNTPSYELAKILQLPASFAGYKYFNIVVFDSSCETQACQKEMQAIAKIADVWARNTKKFR